MRRSALLLTAALAASLGGCSLLRSARPTYNVFFADRLARIDEAGRTTIVEAARVANAHPSEPVILGGFADAKSVDSTRARELAGQRVDAVSEALASVGVNTARIVRAPYVGDPEASAGVASRRVEIDIGR